MKIAMWAKMGVALFIGFAAGFCVGLKREPVYLQTHWESDASDEFNQKIHQISERMDDNDKKYQEARRIHDTPQ